MRGISYVSDIAIDDVAILQGDECAVKNESTSVTVGVDGGFLNQFPFKIDVSGREMARVV